MNSLSKLWSNEGPSRCQDVDDVERRISGAKKNMVAALTKEITDFLDKEKFSLNARIEGISLYLYRSRSSFYDPIALSSENSVRYVQSSYADNWTVSQEKPLDWIPNVVKHLFNERATYISLIFNNTVGPEVLTYSFSIDVKLTQSMKAAGKFYDLWTPDKFSLFSSAFKADQEAGKATE